jgi:hypothetical protein
MPPIAANLPGAQEVQVLWFVMLYRPGEQTTHSKLAALLENRPAGQSWQ